MPRPLPNPLYIPLSIFSILSPPTAALTTDMIPS
jgi:hypothetical protein